MIVVKALSSQLLNLRLGDFGQDPRLGTLGRILENNDKLVLD